MKMLAQKQSLGFAHYLQLKRGPGILLILGMTACAANPFVGHWDCDQIKVEAQDFSGIVTSELHYYENQTFIYEISYHYDFPQARSLKIDMQAVGTYEFDDTVFTENHESSALVDYESNLGISNDDLAEFLAAVEPDSQTWGYYYNFPTADLLKLEPMDDDEAFTCRRIP